MLGRQSPINGQFFKAVGSNYGRGQGIGGSRNLGYGEDPYPDIIGISCRANGGSYCYPLIN